MIHPVTTMAAGISSGGLNDDFRTRIPTIVGISPLRPTNGNNIGPYAQVDPPVEGGDKEGETGQALCTVHVPQTLIAGQPPVALALNTRPQQERPPANIQSLITRVHPAAAIIPAPLDHRTSSTGTRRRRRARCTCFPVHVRAALVQFVGWVSLAGRCLCTYVLLACM